MATRLTFVGFIGLALLALALLLAPMSAKFANQAASLMSSNQAVEVDESHLGTLTLPPMARDIPPVDCNHNGCHTPASDETARLRVDALITSWTAVTLKPNPNWDKPPDLKDSFRCFVTVLGGEIIRIGTFRVVKITPSNIYGDVNIYNPDGSGWVTSFENGRWGKEMVNPDNSLKIYAGNRNKTVVNQLVDCFTVGMFPPPPPGLTAP